MTTTVTPSEADVATPAVKVRRRWLLQAVQSLMIVIGVGVLMYSGAASWFTARQQAEAVTATSTEFSDQDASSLAKALAEAETYNARIAANMPVDDLDYNAILATGTGAMGFITIPSIATELPIYHGASDATLALGVGHLENTGFPIGGETNHAALSAHHGIPEAQMFNRLDELLLGDRFTISIFGRTTAYQVIDTAVVLPEEVEHLAIQPGRDLVTLITCTPTGINTHRLLVTAERVELDESLDGAADGRAHGIDPGFPWWAVAMAGAITIAVTYFIWSTRPPTSPTQPRRTTSRKDPS